MDQKVNANYNVRRGPCPICGFKAARIEEYRLITQEGAYHVKMIRCPKKIINKVSKTQKAKVGGCGEITVRKKKVKKTNEVPYDRRS